MTDYFTISIKKFTSIIVDEPRYFVNTQRTSFYNSYTIVNVYYAYVFYIIVSRLGLWDKWLGKSNILPLWPLFWVNQANYDLVVNVIFTITLVFTFLSLFFSHKRLLRALIFISLLLYFALTYSFGKVGHSFHVLIYISFLLIFLPDKKKSEMENSIYQRQIYLNTIFTSQLIFMLTYSLSGFWKIVTAMQQFFNGDIHAFSNNALALLIYIRLGQTNTNSILGNYIIENPIIGWPMYVFAIYLEFFSLVAVFRPSIHRLWGMFLIILHIFIYLTMTIGFATNVFLLALFFILSPFNTPNNKFNKVIYDLPCLSLLCQCVKYIKKRKDES